MRHRFAVAPVFRAVATATASASLVLACSAGTQQAGYPDIGAFCAAKAHAICQISDRCAFDAQQCEAYQDGLCRSDAKQATASGTRVYNTANASTCVDALNRAFGNGATSVAFQLLKGPGSLADKCQRVFAGSAMMNSACTTDYDCQGNLLCVLASPGGTSLVCAKAIPTQKGDYCQDPGSQCSTDTYCGKQPNNLWLCASAAGPGSVCNDAVPCVSEERCVAGTCQMRLGLGDLCNSDGDCPSVAPYCDQFAAPGICTAGLSFATHSADCIGIAGLGAGAGGDGGAAVEGGPSEGGDGMPAEGGQDGTVGASDAANDGSGD
jgi:hypothetical protein